MVTISIYADTPEEAAETLKGIASANTTVYQTFSGSVVADDPVPAGDELAGEGEVAV